MRLKRGLSVCYLRTLIGRKNEYICSMSKREKIIRKIKELTISKYPDAEVYLYGSQARQEAHQLSDWDLLVLLNVESVTFAMETKIMDEFYELELELGEIISPLIYPKTAWINKYQQTPLFENIDKEAIRLK